jgi:hypothetical protein
MPIALGVIGMSLCLATGAFAQGKAPVARTPDGQPDIQGYWTEEAGGPEAVNVETAFQTADSLRVTGWTDAQLAARVPVSAIIDAPGGRIPYQPWALKRREEIFHRYGGDDITGAPQSVRDVSSELLCVIGAPRLMFFADFQIVQTPDQIVMMWERSSDFRIIPLREAAQRRLERPLGRQHARNRHDESQRLELVRLEGLVSHRRDDAGRAIDGPRSQDDRLQGDRDRSEGIHAAVDDELHAETAAHAGRALRDLRDGVRLGRESARQAGARRSPLANPKAIPP